MPYKDPKVRSAYNKTYGKLHYVANKARYLENNRRRRDARIAWFRKVLQTLSCTSCGFDETCALEFHHVEGKKSDNMHLLLRVTHFTQKKIREELGKCVLLCANCHRKAHAGLVDVAVLPRASMIIQVPERFSGSADGVKPE